MDQPDPFAPYMWKIKFKKQIQRKKKVKQLNKFINIDENIVL